MKRARKRRIKPRNPVAVAPLLKKGGAHEPKNRKASRARLKNRLRRELNDA